jgi:hypothetical protein
MDRLIRVDTTVYKEEAVGPEPGSELLRIVGFEIAG